MLFLSQQNMLPQLQNSPIEDIQLSGGILSKTTKYILAGNLKATLNAITLKKKFFPQMPSASLCKN